MDQPLTCGQGLAERSALPAQLSALAAAMADNLERHKDTLDVADENARKERDAYDVLERDFRSIADQLRATAERMVGYRALPMGRHDPRAIASPSVRDTFATFIERERHLVAVLESSIKQDEAILVHMRHELKADR